MTHRRLPGLFPALIVLMLAPCRASARSDVLGLWFDDSARSDTLWTSALGESVTVHLLLLDPSVQDCVSGWECSVETVGAGAGPVSWSLRDGLNVDNAPQFQVGIVAPGGLAAGPAVLLATGRLAVTHPDSTVRFFVHPYRRPSLETPPGSGFAAPAALYIGDRDPGVLRQLVWSHGSEALPAAVINPRAGGPVRVISPHLLAYGHVALGEARDRPFDVANVGADTLVGSVAPPPCASFRIIDSGKGRYSLGPGEVRRFLVRFQPYKPGEQSCAIADPESLALRGIGYEPGACTVAPATLDFGQVVLGGVAQRTLVVRNVSGSPVTGTLPMACGPFAPEGATGAFFLAPGDSLAVTMVFAPDGVGDHACHLDLGTGCGPVDCVGTGVDRPPACWLSARGIPFGVLAPGETRERSMAIRNSGGGWLEGYVGLAGEPAHLPFFSLPAGAGPFRLGPGDSVVVNVRYAPTTAGAHVCRLITGTGLCGEVVVTGGTPFCVTAPTLVDFGAVTPHRRATRTLGVTNDGVGSLTVAPRVSGDGFACASTGSREVLEGQTVYFVVEFVPRIVGSHTGFLELGGGCEAVPLVGHGVQGPICRVEPNGFAWPPLVVGSRHPVTFSLSNDGDMPMDGAIPAQCGDFEVVEGAGAFTLPPGGERLFSVDFHPIEPGTSVCLLEVRGTGCGSVSLRGTGITSACAVSPVTVDFDTVQGGYHDRVATFMNLGPQVVSIAPCIEPGGGPFSIVQGTSGSVPVLATRAVTVRYRPTTLGYHEASLDFASPCDTGRVRLIGFAADVPPVCEVIPGSLDFGFVLAGSSRDERFRVRNVGGGRLTGLVQASYAWPFEVTSGSGFFSLAAGESLGVVVTYAPTSAGHDERVLPLLQSSCSSVNLHGLRAVPGQDLLGVWFDLAERRATHFTMEPQEPVTAHLAIIHPTRIVPLTFWQCRAVVSGGALNPVWRLPDGTSFAGTSVDFDYAGPPIAQVDSVYQLATLDFLQADQVTVTRIWLEPTATSFFPGLPNCRYGLDSYARRALLPAAGDWSGPAATVNAPQAVSVTALAPSIEPAPGGVLLRWPCDIEVLAESARVYRRTANEAASCLTTAPVPCGPRGGEYHDDLTGATSGEEYRYSYALLRAGRECARSPEAVWRVPVGGATRLDPVFPNPFNPHATISFLLAGRARVRLSVYDLAGRLVRRLCDDTLMSGEHARVWDGRDEDGAAAPSGTYYARLEAGGVVALRKMVLLR